MDICKRCIIPLEETLLPYLPSNSIPFQKNVCNLCYILEQESYMGQYFGSNNIFQKELNNFLNKRKKVVFAYSGGLDSTIVLDMLNKESKKRGIELFCFTINHGFKGYKTLKNIDKVIKFEGLLDNYQIFDITQENVGNRIKVFDFYADFFKRGEIPCGINCNKIMNLTYKKILSSLKEDILITGGDTPKFNQILNRYSIFWEKSDIVILRGGIAFGLNKDFNRDYIINEGIPWEDPSCGGYDTDCLLPGTIFTKSYSNECHREDIIKKLPIVLEYLSERVRWGIIKREDALERISHLDYSDISSYNEIISLITKQ